MNNLTADLERLALQEQQLMFEQFDPNIAWNLGCEMQARASGLQAAVVIDISLHDRQLFYLAMPGTTPDNADWVRRKRNTVLRCHQSSYAIGLKSQLDDIGFFEKTGASLKDYTVHGGSFPIMLKNLGCIGAITVSGLPQRQDHNFVIETLAKFLEQPLETLRLELESTDES